MAPTRRIRSVSDNEYQITVSATEVWDGSDESLPAKRTDLDLTVDVQNVDDPGELTLQWLQPEVGTDIDAILTDPDGATPTTGSVTASDKPGLHVVHLQGCRPRGWHDFHWNVNDDCNR